MSGVSNFVSRNGESNMMSPTQLAHRKADRQSAQLLKLKDKKSTVNSAGTAHAIPSMAPNPNIPPQFQGDVAPRNTYPSTRYHQNQPFDIAQTGGRFAESEVGSDFDETNHSSINFDQNHDYNEEGPEDRYAGEQRIMQELPVNGGRENGYSNHQNRKQRSYEHKRSHSVTAPAEVDQYNHPGDNRASSSISGRFHRSQARHNSVQPQSRHNSATEQNIGGSKKRGRQNEYPREFNDNQPHQSVEKDEVLPAGPHAARGDQKVVHEGSDRFKASSDEESSSTTESPSRRRKHLNKGLSQSDARSEDVPKPVRQRVHEPEIDDDTLSRMSFADLKNQPFEHGPAPLKSIMPKKLKTATIAEKMESIAASKDPESIVKIFKEMPIDEWEQAGDWILTQFGEILQKLKEARKNKREIAAEFEKELEAQEKAVRGKSEGLGKLLDNMQTGAQGLLRGASPAKS